MENRLTIKSAGAFIFVMLLLFLFFSRTFYTFRLPVVTAVSPSHGKLNKQETVTGISAWNDTLALYAPLAGTVAELLVRRGDRVTQGQLLARISYQVDDLEQKLRENKISQDKIRLELENIRMKIEKTNRAITELIAEAYQADPVSTYELSQLDAEVGRAEAAYIKQLALYEADIITRQEMEKALFDYESLKMQRANLIITLAETEAKNAADVEMQENNRRKQLADYQYELDTMQQEIKAKNLELANLTLQRESTEKSLADYSAHAEIFAPEDGTILSLDMQRGQFINANQVVAEMGLGQSFVIECNVSLNNNFIMPGDICSVSNASHRFKAVVAAITPTENAKAVTLYIDAENISAGETFDITFEKNSTHSFTLVPNSALNKDGDGYYVYVVKRRDGMLGKEFYAQKMRVYTGDSDAENTVITQGISFFEPIVLLSDRFFEENDTIKLKNEGDFFDN